MNTLFDLAVYTESIYEELSDICLRGKLAMEESFREYENNLEESQLKVLSESGTYDDLSYLYEAAGNGMIEKLKNIIKKIKDSIIKGVTKMRDAVKSFFTKSNAEKALKDAAKAAAKNPKVKNAKVSIIDVDKSLKELDKMEAKVDKKIALFKKGKFKDSDVDELDEVEKDKDGKGFYTTLEKERKAISVERVTLVSRIVEYLFEKEPNSMAETITYLKSQLGIN